MHSMIKNSQILKDLIDEEITGMEINTPSGLYEPINYIVQLGGKRLRPLLVLMSYQLFNNKPEEIINQALSVELFHNFTLMHDDIMDQAPLRRNSATVHKKWDVNTAILSGDVMLVKSYELLLEKRENLYDILKSFNRCATGVCEGQQYDMDFEKQERVSEEEYLNMIRLKTAVLLGFSLELGALLSGKPSEAQTLYNFGVNMGMGFQLMDDYLDAFGDPKKFGKQVGGDIISGKKTYLTIKAYEKATQKQKKVLDSYYENGSGISNKNKVEGVMKIYKELSIEGLVAEKMNLYFGKSKKYLKKVNAPLHRKKILDNFLDEIIGRDR